MNTIEKLNELANIKAMLDALALQKAELLAAAMPAEVKARMEEIEAEFSGKAEQATAKAAALEAEVRAEVVASGASVKGDYLHAIYTKGRTSWDSKSLDGYAAAHPEIITFRKVGEPSVSIRKI